MKLTAYSLTNIHTRKPKKMETTTQNTTNANTTETAVYIGKFDKTQITAITRALSTDPHRALLNHALLTFHAESDKTVLVSTDTHRMHVCKMQDRNSGTDIGAHILDASNIDRMMKKGDTLEIVYHTDTQKLTGSIYRKSKAKDETIPLPDTFMNVPNMIPANYPRFDRVIPEVYPYESFISVNWKYLADFAGLYCGDNHRVQFNGTTINKPLVICDRAQLIGTKEVPASPLYTERVTAFAVIMPMAYGK